MASNEILDKYLEALPRTFRMAKIQELCDLCGVSYDIVYNWRKGRTQIDIEQRDKIMQITGIDIFTNN